MLSPRSHLRAGGDEIAPYPRRRARLTEAPPEDVRIDPEQLADPGKGTNVVAMVRDPRLRGVAKPPAVARG